MQYKEKILELIFAEDEQAFMDWGTSHPKLEQVDILREFRQVNDTLIAELGKKINAFEAAHLDVVMESLQLDLLDMRRQQLIKEKQETQEAMLRYMRECIETSAPNAPAIREQATKIMMREKENGLYDPLKWAWLEARSRPVRRSFFTSGGTLPPWAVPLDTAC